MHARARVSDRRPMSDAHDGEAHVAEQFERVTKAGLELDRDTLAHLITTLYAMPQRYEFGDRLYSAVFGFFFKYSGLHNSAQVERGLAVLAELVHKRQSC